MGVLYAVKKNINPKYIYLFKQTPIDKIHNHSTTLEWGKAVQRDQ